MLSQKPQISVANFTVQDESISPKSMSLLPIFGAEVVHNHTQKNQAPVKLYQNPLKKVGSPSIEDAGVKSQVPKAIIVPQEDFLLPTMTAQGQLNFLGSAMI